MFCYIILYCVNCQNNRAVAVCIYLYKRLSVHAADAKRTRCEKCPQTFVFNVNSSGGLGDESGTMRERVQISS